MKKFLSILLLGFYCWGAFGMGLQSDYCCGHWESAHLQWGLMGLQSSSHALSGHGCCNTETQFLKIQQKHIPSQSKFQGPLAQRTLSCPLTPQFAQPLAQACTSQPAGRYPQELRHSVGTFLFISCIRI